MATRVDDSAEKTDSMIQEVFGQSPTAMIETTAEQTSELTIKPPAQKEEAKQTSNKEALVFDFTSAFKQDTKAGRQLRKKKGAVKKPKQFDENGEEIPADATDDVNKDLEDANMHLEEDQNLDPETLAALIPRNLQITQQEMAQRKVMDIRRWFCMARPQYPKSCGISSLVSCWNYLYSTLGVGKKQPISTEEALEVLGFKPPYHNVSFGSFTGNDTLIQWFGLLNRKFGVRGDSSIVYKKNGASITHNVDKYQALENLKEGLKSENRAYIYHCYNHYMCPIGFEMTPTKPIDAYSLTKDIAEFDTWIIIGEISKCYPCFHTKRWEQIVTDIECGFPQFMNIRKSEVGVQEKTSKAFTEGKHKGGNLHCIMEFRSSN